jgi:hypothetical protein
MGSSANLIQQPEQPRLVSDLMLLSFGCLVSKAPSPPKVRCSAKPGQTSSTERTRPVQAPEQPATVRTGTGRAFFPCPSCLCGTLLALPLLRCFGSPHVFPFTPSHCIRHCAAYSGHRAWRGREVQTRQRYGCTDVWIPCLSEVDDPHQCPRRARSHPLMGPMSRPFPLPRAGHLRSV